MWHDPLALDRLSAAIVVVAVALAGHSAARWVAQQERFAVRSLVVETDAGRTVEHLSAEQVARFCLPRISGTVFTADIADLRSAFESLPWVRRASVRRQWPDRLVVHVEEHQALARWNDDAGNRFVSVLGEAFAAPGEADLGRRLPLLGGPEGSQAEVARGYATFRRSLAPIGKEPVVVMLSARQAWTLRLGDGLVLEMGRDQPSSSVISRLERFVANHASTLGRLAARVEVVDLRYANGFAVRVPGLKAALAPPRPASSRPPPRRPAAPLRGARAAGRGA
ncbi:MAG: cell division protein FtsQ/DivIB [Burkholderiales bacterium]|nr:cell division protein FtsQ/DivIB [Burkholderiales bacterium]